MIHPTPQFSENDLILANEEWGANCGPGALAAIVGMSLEHIRQHMGDFQRKGYTNPTLMFSALENTGRVWRRSTLEAWPTHGLARIQWHGPWMQAGVPIRARYRHTHWVASFKSAHTGAIGIFDINALSNGTGWCSLDDWQDIVVPWIIKECVPRGDGGWHITHAIEVRPS